MGLIDWLGGLIDSGASSDYNKYKTQLQGLIGTRPDYIKPTSVDEYLNIAKSNLNSRMPEYDRMLSDVNSSVSTGISNAQTQSNSATGTLGAAASLYNKSMQSRNAINTLQEQYKEKMKDKYAQSLLVGAEYEDKAWNWNKGQKYQEQYNYLQSLVQSAAEDKRTSDSNAFRIAGL